MACPTACVLRSIPIMMGKQTLLIWIRMEMDALMPLKQVVLQLQGAQPLFLQATMQIGMDC